jgi:hypothetical protein
LRDVDAGHESPVALILGQLSQPIADRRTTRNSCRSGGCLETDRCCSTLPIFLVTSPPFGDGSGSSADDLSRPIGE